LDFIFTILNNVLPFLIILTILVFVHELGHYSIARYNNVKVEVFSIGFGKELFGYTDKDGTRWKFSLIPLGGYVKMHGDQDEASSKSKDDSEVDKNISFHHKSIGQRSAILFAGPAANYIFSFLLLIFINCFYGAPSVKPIISEVVENGVADTSGIKENDIILSINDKPVQKFSDIKTHLNNRINDSISLTISRNDKIINFDVTVKNGLLGIKGDQQELMPISFLESIFFSSNQIVDFTTSTLKGIYEIFTGTRGTEDLGGPIRIAELSADFWERGIQSTLWFMVLISLNLGLINLFPIPLLDGGHLLLNLVELIKGKPINQKSLEVIHGIGFFLLISLMIFATFNDVSRFLK
tara:strand:- start:1333 stop:2391 length:1059 start_codon:yes stop_codon:yes gene_type:complete